MATNDLLDSLRVKIARLIAENDKLAADNSALAGRRDRMAAEIRELKRTVAEQEKRIAVLELGASMTGNVNDQKRAVARINRLMREIDRCIALMNR